MGTTRPGVVGGVSAAVLTPVAAFFLHFPEPRLGAAVDLSSGFVSLAISLVDITLGFTSASMTG